MRPYFKVQEDEAVQKITISSNSGNNLTPGVVSLRCPHCGHEGSFEGVGINDTRGIHIVEGARTNYTLGIRRCPRPECFGHIFYQKSGEEMITYPAQRIDFDSSDVPPTITKCLEEAIDCHAHGDDIAAAIMVRKTLEEMCAQQGADGKDLKSKIKNLGTKIVIPQELLTGMDALRLLGNDAAHIEAKAFTEIGSTELEVAIKFTKELLKNCYQYGSLLRELENLKSSEEQTKV